MADTLNRFPDSVSVRLDEVKAKFGSNVELNVGSEYTKSGGWHTTYWLP